MSLKANLIKFMREKDITIRKLAKETGISEPTLKRLRTCDNANPTLDVLIKISTALQVPLPILIQSEPQNLVIHQGETMKIGDASEFIYIFIKDVFNFSKGTKAIFRKFTDKSPITKFILDKKGRLLEKVDEKKSLFRNENYENFSINYNDILAYIVKELFEVNYV